MARQVKPVFHAPMLIRWTDDKLRLLDQDQLLNLLANLDQQRAIGRIGDEADQDRGRRGRRADHGRRGSLGAAGPAEGESTAR